jgi:hypothetical protein
MSDGLKETLGRSATRLNATIVAHRALRAAIVASLATGLGLAALRAMGVHLPYFALWLGISAAAAAIGAIAARSSLMDAAGAARWLDLRMKSEGLLSAALSCVERGSSGRFDGLVVEAAAALLPKAEEERPPMRPIALRAACLAACAALGAYALFLSGYSQAASGETASRGEAESASGSAQDSGASLLASALEGGSAEAASFASSLFPEDRRMATLAERALREGRIDDLRELMSSAGREVDSKLSRPLSEIERKKLTREKDRIGAVSEALTATQLAQSSGGAQRGDESGAANEGRRSQQGGSPDRAAPPRSDRGTLGGGEGGAANRGENSTPDEAGGGSGGEDSGAAGAMGAEGGADGKADRGGKGYGTGLGSAGDWGKITPESGKAKAELAESPNASFFELVLPDSGAKSALGELAPAAARSAESAIAREELPLDHEDFVKSYFMTLSESASP